LTAFGQDLDLFELAYMLKTTGTELQGNSHPVHEIPLSNVKADV
jgi:hypothetical protein